MVGFYAGYYINERSEVGGHTGRNAVNGVNGEGRGWFCLSGLSALLVEARLDAGNRSENCGCEESEDDF